MKNLIEFTDTFDPVLLMTEENELNSIWIDVKTNTNTNQKIRIVTNTSQVTDIALQSNAKNEFELISDYWSLGGNTTLQLINNGFTSEQITITFPAVIADDVTIYESEERHYEIKRKEMDNQELYMVQVIPYRNAMEYNIATAPKRVISISYSNTNAKVNGLFNASILFETSGIEETAIATADLYINDIQLSNFTPRQSVSNGRHVLTITYPIQEIENGSYNNLSVFLSIDSGTIHIAQLAIAASILATGLSEVDYRWNGKLTIDENAPTFGLEDLTYANDATDGITITKRTPIGPNISETEPTFAFTDLTFNTTLQENIWFGDTVSDMTWQEVNEYLWGSLEQFVWGK